MTPTTEKVFKRVLLIDSDDVEIYITKRVIQSLPFAEKLIIHSSSADAITYLSMQSLETLPEVIFLDMKLAELDAFNFLEEFAKFEENFKDKIRIVLLTTVVPRDNKKKGKKNKSIHSIMQKPLTLEALRNFEM